MNVLLSNHIPYSYLATARSTAVSGRIAVPVPTSQLPYSYFKNVAGVASGSSSVYGLDKLKILDTLIERLRSTKSNSLNARESAGSGLTEERIDALIQQYGKELHTALVAGNLPYAKPAGVIPGLLVSLAA